LGSESPAFSLLVELYRQGGRILPQQDGLQVKGRGERLGSDLLEGLVRHKSDLRQLLGVRMDGATGSIAVPLSSAQEEIWAVERARPDTTRFGLTSCVLIKGRLDHAIVTEVLNALVERHVALRTGFIEEGYPSVRQVVHSVRHFEAVVERGPAHLVDDPSVLLRRVAANQARRTFDLAAGPLLDVELLMLGKEHVLLTLRRHHIASDGTSFAIIVDEFCRDYLALHTGKRLVQETGTLGYPAFAAYEQAAIARDGRGSLRKWWRDELSRAARFAAAADRPGQALEPVTLAEHPMRSFDFVLQASLLVELRALSQRCGESLYSTMFALFRLLLEANNAPGAECIGVDASMRDEAEFERTVGLFVNRVPIVQGVEPQSSFESMVAQVGRTLRGALAHKWLAHHEIEAQGTAAGVSCFGYLFGFHNNAHATFSLPGCSVVANHVHNEQEHDVPFVCYLSEIHSSLRMSVAYRALPHTEALASDFQSSYLQLAGLAVVSSNTSCSQFIAAVQARQQQDNDGRRSAFARLKRHRPSHVNGENDNA
jgi:hypothetical protein